MSHIQKIVFLSNLKQTLSISSNKITIEFAKNPERIALFHCVLQQIFFGFLLKMGTLPQSHVVDLELADSRNGGGGGQVPSTSDGGQSLSSNLSGESPVGITDLENKLRLGKNVRDCRICHLNTDSGNQDSGLLLIELGCSCRDDLAVAHKQCAEAWFKIKGNKICEICGSVAQNVTGSDEAELAQPRNGSNDSSTTAIMPTTVAESRNIWRSHRVLNFLLACMVFAFVISWLFHFNMRS